MHRKLYQAISLLLLLTMVGCDPSPVVPEDLPEGAGRSAFVVCEGSLGNGNSTLTLYNTDSAQAFEDVNATANSQPLGDVFQSMTRIGEQYFLCVNNSDKIAVIDRNNYQLSGSISISKPRYILPIAANKAYVTSLFSNKVYIINPQTLQQTGTITLPYSNAEGMALVGDNAYICPWDTAARHVYVMNTTTDQVIDSIATPGRAPQEVSIDKDGMLWALSGNVVKGKVATLARYNPATKALLQSYTFPATADPLRLEWDNDRDTLYYIGVNYNGGTAHNGVYRMSINASTLPQQPFIAAQALQYYWAIGVEPGTNNIFIGDPKGFTQRGEVSVYNTGGTFLYSFKTGVGPGHFLFDY